MSQLAGDFDPDFESGLSWDAFLSIRATGQPRRKVIAEIGVPGQPRPRITLQLDMFDRMKLTIEDLDGKRASTEPVIDPADFVGRPVFLEFALLPSAAVIAGKPAALIRIDGEVKSQLFSRLHMGGTLPAGKSSIGASLESSDPATFDLFELVIAKRPLTDEEVAQLNQYFHTKPRGAAKNG